MRPAAPTGCARRVPRTLPRVLRTPRRLHLRRPAAAGPGFAPLRCPTEKLPVTRPGNGRREPHGPASRLWLGSPLRLNSCPVSPLPPARRGPAGSSQARRWGGRGDPPSPAPAGDPERPRGPCPTAQGEHMPRGAQQPDMPLVFFYLFSPKRKQRRRRRKKKRAHPPAPLVS